MMGLSDSERISMMFSAVLIQYMRVHACDRQTDGQTELAWHIRDIAYMLSRGKTEFRLIGGCMMHADNFPTFTTFHLTPLTLLQ